MEELRNAMRPLLQLCSLTNSITPVLLRCRGRDGIAVVPAEENNGALKGGGEVESGMCITFAGCTLSKIADHCSVGILPFDGVGGTNS